ESRHVALGVMYLPKLLARASRLEHAHNWVFNMELFLLTVAGGEILDPHLAALGVDHRELGATAQRLHEQVIHQMAEETGAGPGQRLRGVYGLSRRQQRFMLDFLHPASAMSPAHARARGAVNRATHAVAGW